MYPTLDNPSEVMRMSTASCGRFAKDTDGYKVSRAAHIDYGSQLTTTSTDESKLAVEKPSTGVKVDMMIWCRVQETVASVSR